MTLIHGFENFFTQHFQHIDNMQYLEQRHRYLFMTRNIEFCKLLFICDLEISSMQFFKILMLIRGFQLYKITSICYPFWNKYTKIEI